jgi:hypothetical protein
MQRIALVVVICLSSLAHAGDSKAWTAAKKVLPANMFAVVGINVSTLRGSDMYKQLVPAMLAQKPDAQKHLSEIKDTCGNDVTGLVDSVVVGVDEHGKGAIVVALRNWSQKDVETCFGKMAKAHSGKFTSDKTGDFTHYHFTDKDNNKDLYLRWLAKDVVALATEPDNKDASQAAIGGGIAGDKALAPLLAGTHSDAAVWAAINKTQDIDQVKAKMTGMYGNADVKSGNVAVDFHVMLDSDKAAADTAKQIVAFMPMLATKAPPSMAALVKSLAVKSNGKEVVLTATDTEKDVADIISSQMTH